jgi:DNA (cytosine-5)-methyltransferase 1
MEWNTQKKIWQLSTDGLLFEHWEPFLGTWQISGTMRNGLVYELPTPEHHTSVSESSLLRSPTASQGEGGALGEEEARKRGNTVGIRDNAMDIARLNGHKVSRAEANLLPTPNTMEHLPPRTGEARERQLHRGGSSSRRNSSGNLREDVLDLLPTPITRDYKDGSAAQTRDGKTSTDTVARAIFNSGEVTLPTPTASDWKGANNSGSGSASSNGLATKIDNLETDWGKFEPAIRRWEETLGRPAPLPTKPDGKDGAHRLSSAFTEWMMGLPEGWVTNVGLTRNEELKACGNGVVPQQAELALRVLLEGVAFEKFQGGMTMFPTPTVSDTYTDNLSSTQQKDGSMHSVTLPQAVRMVSNAAN